MKCIPQRHQIVYSTKGKKSQSVNVSPYEKILRTFHSSSANCTNKPNQYTDQQNGIEDAYLEEKVLSTVSIGLTYKSIQENLDTNKKKFQDSTLKRLLNDLPED